jgi:predicted PurR-regulated permease PerM
VAGSAAPDPGQAAAGAAAEHLKVHTAASAGIADNAGPLANGPTPADPGRIALIERSILVLLIVGLLLGVLEILRPFATAILFGAALATAAWPLRQVLVRRGFTRAMAGTLLLVSSLTIIALPILAVAPHLAERLRQGTERVAAYFSASPQYPAWIAGLPLVGRHLALAWDRAIAAQGNIRALLEPYGANLEEVMIGVARALADSVVQVILSLAVATMFWVNGDALVGVLRGSLRRLGGATAEQVLDVAAGAIRGVAYGVVGTAAIQAVLLAIGLGLAGVPGAGMFGFVGFLLAISQIGAPLLVLIWGAAAWWLFTQDHPTWGVFLIVWGVFISTVDNFLKPWLIGFGIRMPLSLTILGVFGGFIAFGFLGLFIGPTLIAIMFILLRAWRTATTALPPR